MEGGGGGGGGGGIRSAWIFQIECFSDFDSSNEIYKGFYTRLSRLTCTNIALKKLQ